MTKKERNGSQTFLSVCVNVNCRQDLSFCVTFYASVNLPPSQAESVGFFNFLPSPLSLCCGEVGGGYKGKQSLSTLLWGKFGGKGVRGEKK